MYVGGALITGVVENRTFTASGLIPYANYTFKVAGVNDNGTGPFSNVTSILTEEESNKLRNSLLLLHSVQLIYSSRSCV